MFSIVPSLSRVSQEIALHQPYNTACELDPNDVPVDCRPSHYSIPDIDWGEERDEHIEFEKFNLRGHIRALRVG